MKLIIKCIYLSL